MKIVQFSPKYIFFEDLFEKDSYYANVFERFEKGQYLKNLFNPYALLAGPLWYANRRVGFVWCLFACFFFAFTAHLFIDRLPTYFSLPLIFAAYFILFVGPSNFLLYFGVRSFVNHQSGNGNYNASDLRRRFETEMVRSLRKWHEMVD